MEKNLKKVATYDIDAYTPICDVKMAREHLKDCKAYIVDDAVSAFEETTQCTMIAVEYINVKSGLNFNTVNCSGYVWTGWRTAARWSFCYQCDVYTGDACILVIDGNGVENIYKL